MMDQYDSQYCIDNTHLSCELLKKWKKKSKNQVYFYNFSI